MTEHAPRVTQLSLGVTKEVQKSLSGRRWLPFIEDHVTNHTLSKALRTLALTAATLTTQDPLLYLDSASFRWKTK